MKIRVIYTDINTTVVEWEDTGLLRRRKLPFRAPEITEDMLSLSLPYGVDWGEVVLPYLKTPEEVAHDLTTNLHNSKIFTLEEMQNANPNMVLGILLRSFGIDYNKFMIMVQNTLEAHNG